MCEGCGRGNTGFALYFSVYKHNLDATIAFKSRQCGRVVGTSLFLIPSGFDGMKWNVVQATRPNLSILCIVLSTSYQSSGVGRSPNKNPCAYRSTSFNDEIIINQAVQRLGSFDHGWRRKKTQVNSEYTLF